jgi:two-component system response regulator PilR (NtrC family)
VTEQAKTAASKVVLVVDDETGYRDMIQYELGRLGYKTLTAASGPEALELLRDHMVDLVLTDMKMSPMDGLDTVIAIQKLQPNIPIVLMTGYAAEERIAEALQRKASACLRKPFNVDELHGVVHSCVPAIGTSG